jgi:hypothetical protein
MILSLLRNRDKNGQQGGAVCTFNVYNAAEICWGVNSNIYSCSRDIELSKKVEIVLYFVYNDRDVRIGKRRNLYKTGKVW